MTLGVIGGGQMIVRLRIFSHRITLSQISLSSNLESVCLFVLVPLYEYTTEGTKTEVNQKSKYQVCFILHMIVRMIVENNFDLDQPQRGLGGACRRLPRLDNRPRHLHPHRPLLPAQVLSYHLMQSF